MTNNDRPLRIHHVVSDIHRQDAGPSYSVTRLAETLYEQGSEVHLHALDPAPERLPNVPTTFYPRSRLLPSLGISEPMRRGLREAAQTADIMHFHGMWMMPNVYPGWAVKDTDCKLVMSPRGMMEPWAMQWSSGRKRLFGSLLQNRVLDAVDSFHATSSEEAASIRGLGFEAPIFVAPIGIDLPEINVRSASASPSRKLVYLGRIHEKKNVEGLIEAWLAVAPEFKDWELIIAGPGPSEYLQELAEMPPPEASPTISFLGEVVGNGKHDLLSEADAFVMPSFSENFGIVIAEALSYRLPVLTTTGVPWNEVVDRGCGWQVDPDPESLASGLRACLGTPSAKLDAMGATGREWMAGFEWDAIGSRTQKAYEGLLGDRSPNTEREPMGDTGVQGVG